MKILLVEDEKKIADFITQGFQEQQVEVESVDNGLLGEQLFLQQSYDVIILDVIMPGMNGIELCRKIREANNDVPILLLTALGTTMDKLIGFDSGADDYLVKPFHFEELSARVNALARRPTKTFKESILRVADLEMDLYSKAVKRSGKNIFLTAKEFTLLEFLVLNRGKVLSRSTIAESVWGSHFDKGTNIIDVYINYLRSKIDKGFNPPLIHTIIGMGYVLREEQRV
jgi:two-component system, OmpR family, copper resistance phosphate regulon response regulator CusR